MAVFGAARHVGLAGDSSSASSQFNGSTGLHGDVDSPQQSKQLPRNDPPEPVAVSCGIPCGCVFRDSPSGSGARGDEDH